MENLDRGFGYYVKVINNVRDAELTKFMRKEDLTNSQMRVLRYLLCCKEKGEILKQKDLEQYFHISNPTVSVLLDRLEAKGLVEREKSEIDRRVRYVHPTKKAEELLNDINELIAKENQTVMDGLTDEQIEQGMYFLRYITEKLTGKEEKPDD